MTVGAGSSHLPSSASRRDEAISAAAAAAAAAAAGTFIQLSAGHHHTCGVTVDERIACWGDAGEENVASPTGLFQQVAAGEFHSCGLTKDGELKARAAAGGRVWRVPPLAIACAWARARRWRLTQRFERRDRVPSEGLAARCASRPRGGQRQI